MKVKPEKHPISLIVQMYEAGTLVRNPEYQRGEAWKTSQKAAFIDSIFRQYPVPALFLHEVVKPSFDGAPSKKYDIVDGQQRILAMTDYVKGNYALLDASDPKSKLRIPDSIRTMPAPWSRSYYSELSASLKKQFNDTLISIFFVEAVEHADEIRDLFIRLQSGTALTRQQIRDAWPGNIGPFVESLAGKLNKQPQKDIFRIIDKRGSGSETDNDVDQFASDRQTCAQMLAIFLARQRDAYALPSVSANDLDALYHSNTQFDPDGEEARLFRAILDRAANVFNHGHAIKKRKFRRAEVFSVLMFLQDYMRSPAIRVDAKLDKDIWLALEKTPPVTGKATSKVSISNQYEALRTQIDKKHVIVLDPKRIFDEAQKTSIRLASNGLCGVCGVAVDDGTAEYDHFPVPHRDGGKTATENGRLVHQRCHPRGRPQTEEDK